MRYYFLVEGKKTEMIVYPEWLKLLRPDLMRIFGTTQAEHNLSCYYLLSAGGFPRLLGEPLENCLKDLRDYPYFDVLVLVCDADEDTVATRKATLRNRLESLKEERGLKLAEHIRVEIIIQNRCMETWLLGNANLLPRNVGAIENQELRTYAEHYHVGINDPEKMPFIIQENFNTHAQFHEAYLKLMLKEKNTHYSKSTPREVCQEYYLKQLQKRFQETTHISSFGQLLALIQK